MTTRFTSLQVDTVSIYTFRAVSSLSRLVILQLLLAHGWPKRGRLKTRYSYCALASCDTLRLREKRVDTSKKPRLIVSHHIFIMVHGFIMLFIIFFMHYRASS